ncbi:hypothetical protein D3C86_2126850 [compost metagenome]
MRIELVGIPKGCCNGFVALAFHAPVPEKALGPMHHQGFDSKVFYLVKTGRTRWIGSSDRSELLVAIRVGTAY